MGVKMDTVDPVVRNVMAKSVNNPVFMAKVRMTCSKWTQRPHHDQCRENKIVSTCFLAQ